MPMHCMAHAEDHRSGVGPFLLAGKLIRNIFDVPAISLVGLIAFKIQVCKLTSIINILENVNMF